MISHLFNRLSDVALVEPLAGTLLFDDLYDVGKTVYLFLQNYMFCSYTCPTGSVSHIC